MLKEFKEFIAKGNVLDLAVGIIIGAAFTAIVGSFVKDIINPIIGLAGKANFDNMFLILRAPDPMPLPFSPSTAADAEKAGAVVLKYGSFLTNVLNFLIVAFVVFLIVKAVNKAKAKEAPKVEEVPSGPTPDQVLLTEIRDLLKSGK